MHLLFTASEEDLEKMIAALRNFIETHIQAGKSIRMSHASDVQSYTEPFKRLNIHGTDSLAFAVCSIRDNAGKEINRILQCGAGSTLSMHPLCDNEAFWINDTSSLHFVSDTKIVIQRSSHEAPFEELYLTAV